MKIVRGYIFSRAFLDERAPQHVQNIVIRDYCKKNFLNFMLSVSEYRMKNSFKILENTIKNLKEVDGIVAYSLLMLPEKESHRNKILKKIILKKKFLSFAVEDITVKNRRDINYINTLWKIKKALKKRYLR